VKDVVNHIDHIVKLVGINHIGIGTDFDGGGGVADCYDVSQIGNITEELVRRGYSEKEIRKIWGENFLRVMQKVEELAQKS
jgi:membrane dipeptidase